MKLKTLIHKPIEPTDKLVVCTLDRVKRAVQNIPSQQELEWIAKHPRLYALKQELIINLSFDHPYIKKLHSQIDNLKKENADLKSNRDMYLQIAQKQDAELKKIKKFMDKIGVSK